MRTNVYFLKWAQPPLDLQRFVSIVQLYVKIEGKSGGQQKGGKIGENGPLMDPCGTPSPKTSFDYIEVNKSITAIQNDSNQTSAREFLIFLKNMYPRHRKRVIFQLFFFGSGEFVVKYCFNFDQNAWSCSVGQWLRPKPKN